MGEQSLKSIKLISEPSSPPPGLRRLDSAHGGSGLTDVVGEQSLKSIRLTSEPSRPTQPHDQLLPPTRVKPRPSWAESSLRSPVSMNRYPPPPTLAILPSEAKILGCCGSLPLSS